MKVKSLVFIVFATVFVAGCTGPKGDTGPMGPSGTKSPTYIYNQAFDSVGYSLGSEWAMNNNGFGGSISLDTTSFISGMDSMKVTGGSGVAGGVYTQNGVVSYSPSNGDFDVDFYWNPSGIVTASVKVEAVFVNSGVIMADLGFAYGSTNTFYVYSGGTAHTVESVTSSPYYHHIVMVYHPSTTLSDYYDDGNLIAQGVNVGKTVTVSGAPTTWAGFIFPASLGTTPDTFNVDNFQIYHY